MRIDPEPVARTRRVEPGEHRAGPFQDADRRPLLADVGHLLLVEPDVGRLLDVAPLRDELALGGEDLDPAVLPVTDIHRAVGPDPEAVRQVELPRRLLARVAPGGDEAAVLRAAMHAGVAGAGPDGS